MAEKRQGRLERSDYARIAGRSGLEAAGGAAVGLAAGSVPVLVSTGRTFRAARGYEKGGDLGRALLRVESGAKRVRVPARFGQAALIGGAALGAAHGGLAGYRNAKKRRGLSDVAKAFRTPYEGR